MDARFLPYLGRIEQEIAAALPRSLDKEQDAGWAERIFGREFPAVRSVHWQNLVEPCRELIDLGGKRWRPLLLVLCAQASLESRGQKTDADSTLLTTAYRLAPLLEFIHTASLIHDDIEDSSTTRRGKDAAYITWGLDTAINAASWLYFVAASCIDSLAVDDGMKLLLYRNYAMELRRLHLGQAMDIAWHRAVVSASSKTAPSGPVFPSGDEYIAMVRNKTGTLASLAAKIGVLSAGADEQTALREGETASYIGAGFQVIDDVINLTSGNPGKKRGDDIVEGKRSLPVLLFADLYAPGSGERTALLDCFARAGREGIESPAVEEAIAMLDAAGVIQRAREQGIRFIQEGCAAFQELFGAENEAAGSICNLFYSMIPAIL
ncbi:MAG: polyprenyl synthetase family protein [Treponema sp.]|nr:polyprenyl synthetase family protein [Treponema sp.]